ncbi:IS66 family insertion sequence element accessory protein TnpB [Thorsellia anophelis]|uniref:Transposase n=1 Tax=Thorsellia anophelis DSM 18579 TaxID=1123402 RepID=A0A1I0FMA1_9GAMM|nr:IS66 family insertion sequence element accessory protein TnpB [Thorsellia anophelis]SET59437.1 transposase [Thorsellia anophelis DSM 18579]
MMLQPNSIYFVNQPIDMRYEMTWFTSFVQEHFKGLWQNGAAFIFINRRANVIKILQLDSHGVWLCQRKLHQNCFPKLKFGEVHLSLSTSQFE